MKTFRNASFLFAFASLAGCAPALPPQDLVTARASYARASHGAAATLDPAELHSAAESLQNAEGSFTDEGDTQRTRDLSYVADRRAQIAEAAGETKRAANQQGQTLTNMHAAETAHADDSSSRLGRANLQLAVQDQSLRSQNQQLDTERDRRQDAEKRAAQAAADLASIATVKQDATRGMVITLSGGVLFASNRADLLPSAQAKLNEVAAALSKNDSDSKIVVEGHTDSQGGAEYNQDLSQRRAQTVRDYLVSRKIAADRVTATGFGLTRPIADNASPEGRANNRRVEIVVQPASP
ncbi:MAG TPA: OmpA family protein [Polyangiaceae bacterium]|nr:OmpA family protein [Polyangiaceae bacterium]